MSLRCLWVIAVGWFLTSFVSGTLRGEDDPVSYNRDIRPILASRCLACHGPDEEQRKADLRFDTNEAVADNGVIKPGKADESELLARITSTDPDTQMPPAASKKPALTAEEIALIRRWVNQGAKYDQHWAFVPPARPAIPAVKQQDWPQGDIDRFVLAKLESQGLAPSPAADARTLVRRLSFDLRGLPPTAEEVAQFERDPSPAAWEKLVDQMLASPHYGERMAIYWLDLVRFADTIGYHSDNVRNITPYRDYVINAFNRNLPYDQFAREQIAGDLLPDATIDQKVASGYNRLLQTTEEGGAQAKEYLAKYDADRVRNFGSAWLALTTGCCECHNHKFDPLSIRDFYSLAAFFADIQEPGVGKREPGLSVPTSEQLQQLESLRAQIVAGEAELKSSAEKLAADMNDPGKLSTEKIPAWLPITFEKFEVQGESSLTLQDDGSLKSTGKVAAKETYELLSAPSVEVTVFTGIRLEALADDALPSHGPGTATNGNFVLTEFKVFVINAEGKERPVKIEAAVADHSQDNFDIASSFKGGSGWAILPQAGQSHEAIYQLEKTELKVGDRLKIRLAFQSPHVQHNIGRVRLSITDSEIPAINWISGELDKIVAKPAGERSPAEQAKVTDFFRDRSPSLAPLREKVKKLQAELKQIDDSVPKSLISMAGNARPIRILARGNWLDDSGEVVPPAVPVSITVTGWTPPEKPRLGRLELVDWMMHQDNPLTARVFVNRLWKLTFGRGIVRTLDDFGTQAEWPTHPELLDWLAVEFRESGWNIKHVLKLMVMSQAYRQTSIVSPQLQEADARNQWFARQNRFRLDAEMVRDNALAASGLLVEKIGGPSVKPYQPAGYWQYLNFPRREWQNDKGDGLYRRGLYTFWQRTFLQPSLAAFDAPSREECVVERARSNTPQQALALLNDPTYVEAARALAANLLKAHNQDSERLKFLFSSTLQRAPRPAELELLLPLLEKHREQYAQDPAAADKLLKVGNERSPADLPPAELAAWTSVCRVVLNLHETITRN